jgi:midasin
LYGFCIEKGPLAPKESENFLVTPTFEKYIYDLLRAINFNLPVLLEGPTSSGKTSLVKYIASLTGHKCVRVNNH